MVLDSEVEERVNILDSLRLEDDQPNIEAPAMSVACDTTIGFSYQDRNAYDTHWIDETVVMEKLVRMKYDPRNNHLWSYKHFAGRGLEDGRKIYLSDLHL
jgi:hypothetical protein